ncbi:phosphatase PAP2 family protein [uncultured Paracoccus sp.]|uniref:phosphatase PAP2 family protein n=1 Tax=uncultured Paracoccus sp. TaxID=189685 RepID=UPI002617914E|nr:phosphatase PAP2 family protein [uncultured Paracoccus sp.]
MVPDTLIALDHQVFAAIHQFYGLSWAVDSLIWLISTNPLFKGVVSAMMFWWLWFRPHPQLSLVRSKLSALLLLSVVAIFLGRLLALQLPFRDRPFMHPELIRWSDDKLSSIHLDGWSSMPSDHAVMYFALATGYMIIDRKVGTLALLHAALVISLTRVYNGVHFPGDILVGALLGVAAALLLMQPLQKALLVAGHAIGAVDLSSRRPELFYPLMFLVTLQFATMFETARGFVGSIGEILFAVLS